MENNARLMAKTVAAMLIISVITQALYMATLSGVGIVEGWPLRSTIWTVELLVFTLSAAAAFVVLARSGHDALAWSALGVAGLFNALQAGIGLSMFLPATEAGESFAPLMQTVLVGAFLFYFLAKVLIGLAGILLGLRLFKTSGAAKIVGVLALITAAAALLTNIAALPQGMGFVFPAGATGTVATFFTALAIWMMPQDTA